MFVDEKNGRKKTGEKKKYRKCCCKLNVYTVYIYIYMCVCVYVCMYVCMYVKKIYIYIYVCIYLSVATVSQSVVTVTYLSIR